MFEAFGVPYEPHEAGFIQLDDRLQLYVSEHNLVLLWPGVRIDVDLAEKALSWVSDKAGVHAIASKSKDFALDIRPDMALGDPTGYALNCIKLAVQEFS